jgi:hypothetical protein
MKTASAAKANVADQDVPKNLNETAGKCFCGKMFGVAMVESLWQGCRGKPRSTKPWLAKSGREKQKAKGKKKLLNGPPNYQTVVF